MNITFSKVKSATIDQGKRFLKVLGIGGSAYTAKECAPFGFDSMPPENHTAIYAETSNKSEAVILGYINKNQLASVGEARMYSVGEDGATIAYISCRSGGNVEINGNQYTAVRFSPLKTAIDAKDDLIDIELQKISVALAGLGVTYTPVPITTNFANVESQKVKLK